ncbi:WYL domain-containing protein [Actinokineospora soli]
MLETSARLLRLLSLLQTPRDWSGAELADRLSVNTRTIRRDIDKLRALGYPVNATPGTPGYRLGAGAKLPPLLLDDEEATAMVIGLRTAAAGRSVTGIEESALRALTKVQQVLPPHLRHRVDLLHSATETLHAPAPPVDPATLTTIATACHSHHQLRFDYAKHDGTTTLRTTEPHRLVHTGRRWYLLAWDLDRSAWRTYRVDRLTPRIPTGPRFTPRPTPNPTDHLSRSISTNAYRYQARITIHAPAAVAAQRIAPTTGTLEPINDQTCLLHAGSNSLDELALYVALFGFPFHIHEPPELITHIHTLTARLSAATIPTTAHSGDPYE